MKLPSLSKMFGPIPDPLALPPERIETIRTVDRIGYIGMGIPSYPKWTAVFEGHTTPIDLSVEHVRPFDEGMRTLALTRKGDRLRMVHAKDRLVEVENLSLDLQPATQDAVR